MKGSLNRCALALQHGAARRAAGGHTDTRRAHSDPRTVPYPETKHDENAFFAAALRGLGAA